MVGPPDSNTRHALTHHNKQHPATIGTGNPTASQNHPFYNEDPLNLSLGLHFDTTTRVTNILNHKGVSGTAEFLELETEFRKRCPVDVYAVLQMGVAHTLADRILGLQERVRWFVAVFLFDPGDCFRVGAVLSAAAEKVFGRSGYLAFRFYLVEQKLGLLDEGGGGHHIFRDSAREYLEAIRKGPRIK